MSSIQIEYEFSSSLLIVTVVQAKVNFSSFLSCLFQTFCDRIWLLWILVDHQIPMWRFTFYQRKQKNSKQRFTDELSIPFSMNHLNSRSYPHLSYILTNEKHKFCRCLIARFWRRQWYLPSLTSIGLGRGSFNSFSSGTLLLLS